MGDVTHVVTRLPGAPPRRAGRVWPPGETVAELSEAKVAALVADPGYRVVPLTPPPKRTRTKASP